MCTFFFLDNYVLCVSDIVCLGDVTRVIACVQLTLTGAFHFLENAGPAKAFDTPRRENTLAGWNRFSAEVDRMAALIGCCCTRPDQSMQSVSTTPTTWNIFFLNHQCILFYSLYPQIIEICGNGIRNNMVFWYSTTEITSSATV